MGQTILELLAKIGTARTVAWLILWGMFTGTTLLISPPELQPTLDAKVADISARGIILYVIHGFFGAGLAGTLLMVAKSVADPIYLFFGGRRARNAALALAKQKTKEEQERQSAFELTISELVRGEKMLMGVFVNRGVQELSIPEMSHSTGLSEESCFQIARGMAARGFLIQVTPTPFITKQQKFKVPDAIFRITIENPSLVDSKASPRKFAFLR